jgi:hypothetical protein
VLGPLARGRDRLRRLYDFDLMLGSGRVRGWKVDDAALLERFASALGELADPTAFRARYGLAERSPAGEPNSGEQGSPLLFAVGDGNHSLATAKAVWEEIKARHAGAAASPGEPDIMEHPARYAIAELVNVYDEGLPFHPIHRVLSGAGEGELVAALEKYQEFELDRLPSPEAAIAAIDAVDARASTATAQRVACISPSGSLVITFPKPRAKLAAGSLQDFLDPFLKAAPGRSIDYIHGTESLLALASKPGNLGLYLPPIDKSGFFETVIRDGVMPRKTFSMGEAPEKRFYIEARRITR